MSSSNPQIRVDKKRVGNETNTSPIVFIFSRTGTSTSETHLNGSLEINYELFGTAQKGTDYRDQKAGKIIIESGKSTAELSLDVIRDSEFDPGETVLIKISPSSKYQIAPGAQIAESTIIAEGMYVEAKGNNSFHDWTSLRKNFQESPHSNAFASITTKNIDSWGETQAGGNSSGIDFDGPNNDLVIREIFSSAGVFSALRSDGSVISWGYEGRGGNSKNIDFDGPNNYVTSTGTYVADVFKTDPFAPVNMNSDWSTPSLMYKDRISMNTI